MKNKIYILIILMTTSTLKLYSQTVINTESNLNKIDSTFHLFIDGMGDYKKGNIDFFMIKTNLTIGSRLKEKNLIRFTFSNNYQKFNGTFKNTLSGQLRYNYFYNLEKHNSIFLFSQLGKSKRSMLDRRFLIGGGIRNRVTPSKNSGYIDLAYGAFYENEKYPEYTLNQTTEIPSETYNNLRLTFNVFTRLKLNKHWNLVSVMYSQWKSNRIKNYRIFFDSTLNYIISKKATIFLKFNARVQSEPYIPFIANETDTLIGFRVSI